VPLSQWLLAPEARLYFTAAVASLTPKSRWHINLPKERLLEEFMRSTFFSALALGSALLVASPAVAHHGFSVEFDDSKPVTLTGTVTKMEFMNPHIYFYLDVRDASGRVVNWAFEGSPPNILYRQGWRKDTVKPGDVVTAKGFRARDGAHLVACNTITFQDGRQLSMGNGNVKGYGKN
jgi:Family of unknown function (DUF6152)